MMIARLTLLLLAVAAASAENLRTDAHDVPLDNARGARVLQRMQLKAADKHAKATQSSKTGRADFKKVEAHGRTLQQFDYPWDQVLKTGSLATRSRPNSDCTGVVTEITVSAVGVCKDSSDFEKWDLTGMYVSNDLVATKGEFTPAVGRFDNAECSGEPERVIANEWGAVSTKPCEMLFDNYRNAGAMMGGTVYNSKTVKEMAEMEGPGFMVSNYFQDELCENMLSYTLYRNDACHLDIEFNNESVEPVVKRKLEEGKVTPPYGVPIYDEDPTGQLNGVLSTDSTFSYIKVTMCKDSTVSLTAYTDSACTRKLYRAEVDLGDQTCTYGTLSETQVKGECSA